MSNKLAQEVGHSQSKERFAVPQADSSQLESPSVVLRDESSGLDEIIQDDLDGVQDQRPRTQLRMQASDVIEEERHVQPIKKERERKESQSLIKQPKKSSFMQRDNSKFKKSGTYRSSMRRKSKRVIVFRHDSNKRSNDLIEELKSQLDSVN